MKVEERTHITIPNGSSHESHLRAWDYVAKDYAGGTALPAWGPSGEMRDQQVLPDLRGKTILEIGFGSGDSIVYLLRQGAKRVVGIDFSPAQTKIAHEKLRAVPGYRNKVQLLTQSMDEALPEELFDCIIAVYSVGWSERPARLFKEIYAHLKPGGYFCFSWDHYVSRMVEENAGRVVVAKSYHEPMPLIRENWKGSGQLIETHQLRPSDWFKMLVDAGFTVNGFWEPKPDKHTKTLKINSAVYSHTISSVVPNSIVFRAQKHN